MKSESIKEITAALAKAQIVFLPIKKTEKVDYATDKGRKKYNYAPLVEVIEATKKGLSDNGLAVTQSTYIQGESIILETLLSHSSGEWFSGELYVGRKDQSPQSEGSALTYKRRYGMSAILCVSSEEDDDAQGVEGKDKKIVIPSEMPVKEPVKGDTTDKTKQSPPDVKPTNESTDSKSLFQFADGKELVSYAMKVKKMAWKKIQTDLGIVTPEDIKDIPAAMKVLGIGV